MIDGVDVIAGSELRAWMRERRSADLTSEAIKQVTQAVERHAQMRDDFERGVSPVPTSASEIMSAVGQTVVAAALGLFVVGQTLVLLSPLLAGLIGLALAALAVVPLRIALWPHFMRAWLVSTGLLGAAIFLTALLSTTT